MCVVYFFFFKQKTAYELRISDWSSDVCSSDLSRPSRTRRATRCGTSSTPRGRKSATAWSTSTTIRASASRSNGRRWSGKIGRAACRGRVCKYVSLSVVAVSLKKNTDKRTVKLLQGQENDKQKNKIHLDR